MFYAIFKRATLCHVSIYLREVDGIQKRGTGREEGQQRAVIHPPNPKHPPPQYQTENPHCTPERVRTAQPRYMTPATPGSRFLRLGRSRTAAGNCSSHLPQAASRPSPVPAGSLGPQQTEWPTPARTNVHRFDEVQNFLGTSPLTHQLRVDLKASCHMYSALSYRKGCGNLRPDPGRVVPSPPWRQSRHQRERTEGPEHRSGFQNEMAQH